MTREVAIERIELATKETQGLTKDAIQLLLTDIKKLEQIEQIYREWSDIGDNADSWAFREIRKVLDED